MKTYSEKLKDPRWQRKRLEIFQRDDFTCVVCESTTKTLHVHHIRYIKGREPWEYRNFYFVTLCEDCHKAEEDEIKSVPKRRDLPSAFDRIIDAAPESGDAPRSPESPQWPVGESRELEPETETTKEEIDEFFRNIKRMLDGVEAYEPKKGTR